MWVMPKTCAPATYSAASSAPGPVGSSSRVIGEKLGLFRQMAAANPNDPDVRCWLGVVNILTAERMTSSRWQFNSKAGEALAAARTLDPNNICVQCVFISKLKQAKQMQMRSQYAATDAQCAMLNPYVP